MKAQLSRFADAALRRPIAATALLTFTMAAAYFGMKYPLGSVRNDSA